jgi:hypothetical protein
MVLLLPRRYVVILPSSTYLGTVEHAWGLLIEDDGLPVEVGRHPQRGGHNEGRQGRQPARHGCDMSATLTDVSVSREKGGWR